MKVYLKILAVFYLYGVAVHAGNILGFGEMKWLESPLAWRVADVFYLLIDMLVVVGLWKDLTWGRICFLVAAFSQLVLYGFFSNLFVLNEMHQQALHAMIIFHLVTVVVYFALFLRKR